MKKEKKIAFIMSSIFLLEELYSFIIWLFTVLKKLMTLIK